jgi:hypothetical protein
MLVAPGTTNECPDSGHMDTGISQHQSLDVIFRADLVAVFKPTAIVANFYCDLFHTAREFGISAAQATIHVGIASGYIARIERAGKCQSANEPV